MSLLLASLLASLPNAAIAIASRFVTQNFLQKILEKMIVFSLKKLAPLTTNTLDDDIVEAARPQRAP